MDDNLLEFLRNSAWFENLPLDATKDLINKLIIHNLKENDVLIKKGDLGDSVFIINEGWVKIVLPDESGKGELVLNHLGPGEFVGELSLVDQKPRSASVIALQDLKALELSRDNFLSVLSNNPMMGLYVIINVSNRMRFTNSYLEQAIQWSQKIADGKYDELNQEIENSKKKMIVDNSGTSDARAGRFLGAFFNLLEGVKGREDALMEKVIELSIHIDEDKRDSELESLTNTGFFEKLKSDSKTLRTKKNKLYKSEE